MWLLLNHNWFLPPNFRLFALFPPPPLLFLIKSLNLFCYFKSPYLPLVLYNTVCVWVSFHISYVFCWHTVFLRICGVMISEKWVVIVFSILSLFCCIFYSILALQITLLQLSLLILVSMFLNFLSDSILLFSYRVILLSIPSSS